MATAQGLADRTLVTEKLPMKPPKTTVRLTCAKVPSYSRAVEIGDFERSCTSRGRLSKKVKLLASRIKQLPTRRLSKLARVREVVVGSKGVGKDDL